MSTERRVSVQWQPATDRFEAAGSLEGASVLMNAPHVGPPAGFSATELLLAAAAGCSAWDVVQILRKQREPIEDLQVEVVGTRSDGLPYRYVRLHLEYRARGPGLTVAKVERAVRLSLDKYCSVVNSLRPGAAITSAVVVNKGPEGAGRRGQP